LRPPGVKPRSGKKKPVTLVSTARRINMRFQPGQPSFARASETGFFNATSQRMTILDNCATQALTLSAY